MNTKFNSLLDFIIEGINVDGDSLSIDVENDNEDDIIKFHTYVKSNELFKYSDIYALNNCKQWFPFALGTIDSEEPLRNKNLRVANPNSLKPLGVDVSYYDIIDLLDELRSAGYAYVGDSRSSRVGSQILKTNDVKYFVLVKLANGLMEYARKNGVRGSRIIDIEHTISLNNLRASLVSYMNDEHQQSKNVDARGIKAAKLLKNFNNPGNIETIKKFIELSVDVVSKLPGNPYDIVIYPQSKLYGDNNFNIELAKGISERYGSIPIQINKLPSDQWYVDKVQLYRYVETIHKNKKDGFVKYKNGRFELPKERSEKQPSFATLEEAFRYWVEREARKLLTKTTGAIKNNSMMDKRRFLKILDGNTENVELLRDASKILIIDDNIASGATTELLFEIAVNLNQTAKIDILVPLAFTNVGSEGIRHRKNDDGEWTPIQFSSMQVQTTSDQ